MAQIQLEEEKLELEQEEELEEEQVEEEELEKEQLEKVPKPLSLISSEISCSKDRGSEESFRASSRRSENNFFSFKQFS